MVTDTSRCFASIDYLLLCFTVLFYVFLKSSTFMFSCSNYRNFFADFVGILHLPS